MRRVQFRVLDTRLGDTHPLPTYATEGAAGLDLRAMIEAPLTLEPGGCELVPSGIAIHLSDPDLAALVLPRSGLGHTHGVILGNGTGLIDADYQGQIMVSCWNRGDRPYTLAVGERIAQLVVVPVIRARFELVDAFEASARGERGFGHTGRT